MGQISPEKYRQDRVFTSSANYRAWLSASELLQEGSNGQEELSTAGRALLDGALAEGGDSIFESPIVAEGYCSGGRSVEQLNVSHARPILVRQDLQAPFQLDSGNLGSVPMKTSPPNGIGPTTWDGICIVVLKKFE